MLLCAILPRDAMLARYMSWLSVSVRLSVFVCHKSEFELVFGMGASFDLTYTVMRKFGYLQNKGPSLWNFAPNSGLTENFATASRSRCQHKKLRYRRGTARCVVSVAWNLANCHATVQKLLVRQVLNKSKLWSWRVTVSRCVINMYTQPWCNRVASIVL